MSYLFLLAALMVAGAGVWLSRRQRASGMALMGLGGLGLIAIVVMQVWQTISPPQPKGSNRYEMAVSTCLANCMLGDVAGQSGSVVLLFPSRRSMNEDMEQSYENGFVPPLRHGHGRLALKAIRLEGNENDVAAFQNALAQDRDALAVISFAGAPAGIETCCQAQGPRFYIFDNSKTTHWLAALKDGRIKAVVVPRPGADVPGQEKVAGMPDAIFDRFYLLATSANADEVAASLKP